ncbi:MAG: MmcQ/YjbR family DNA-binding protein [Cytophagales bacterium]|nr:MAG: MmcQ/YjbR family DNA-binding protein [Cytophagales bacterium]
MDIESYRKYCLSKKGVTESLPFGDDTLVFKVGTKVFSLSGIDSFDFINLKCDPEKAIELRNTFNAVKPGYHMNKKHWNTIYLHQDVNNALIYQLIDHSYELVFKSLTKKEQQTISS